jgi:hypothetical protein
MTMRLRAAAYLGLSLLVMAGNAPAQAQESVHGADSLFVAPTIKIAWAVWKGASEDTTNVVIRVLNIAGAYRHVQLDGVDPFTKQRTALIAFQPLGDQIDLSVARVRFADFPSCEIHLYRSEATPVGRQPNLTVFYLGVPDTTPEFSTAQALDAYLQRMLGVQK